MNSGLRFKTAAGTVAAAHAAQGTVAAAHAAQGTVAAAHAAQGTVATVPYFLLFTSVLPHVRRIGCAKPPKPYSQTIPLAGNENVQTANG